MSDRTAFLDLLMTTLREHEKSLSELIDHLAEMYEESDHKVNTPSLMRPTGSEPVKQTLEMILDVLDLLSDKELDRLYAKVCLEKLRRDAWDTITIHGGK